MRLFHASRRKLEIGEVVQAQAPGTFYPEVAELIDESSEPSRPTRAIAVFAAETAAWAARFGEAQFPGKKIHLYEVEMDDCVRAPFCITHQIAKRLKSGENYDKLVSEYLNPTGEWRFYEFYGPSLKVLDDAAPPSQVEVYTCQISYERDVDEAAKL